VRSLSPIALSQTHNFTGWSLFITGQSNGKAVCKLQCSHTCMPHSHRCMKNGCSPSTFNSGYVTLGQRYFFSNSIWGWPFLILSKIWSHPFLFTQCLHWQSWNWARRVSSKSMVRID
jgi:hypothetical protein